MMILRCVSGYLRMHVDIMDAVSCVTIRKAEHLALVKATSMRLNPDDELIKQCYKQTKIY